MLPVAFGVIDDAKAIGGLWQGVGRQFAALV